MLALRTYFSTDDDSWNDSYELRLDEEQYAATSGNLVIERGAASNPDAIIESDPATFGALFGRRRLRLGAHDNLTISGNRRTVERLLAAVHPPS